MELRDGSSCIHDCTVCSVRTKRMLGCSCCTCNNVFGWIIALLASCVFPSDAGCRMGAVQCSLLLTACGPCYLALVIHSVFGAALKLRRDCIQVPFISVSVGGQLGRPQQHANSMRRMMSSHQPPASLLLHKSSGHAACQLLS